MKIRLHEKCNPTGIKEEILLANQIITPILAEYDIYVTVWWIRSITDGEHGTKSLHYPGLAEDIAPQWKDLSTSNTVGPYRPRNEIIEIILNCMKKALGARYDVIYHNNHFHIEYQPK